MRASELADIASSFTRSGRMIRSLPGPGESWRQDLGWLWMLPFCDAVLLGGGLAVLAWPGGLRAALGQGALIVLAIAALGFYQAPRSLAAASLQGARAGLLAVVVLVTLAVATAPFPAGFAPVALVKTGPLVALGFLVFAGRVGVSLLVLSPSRTRPAIRAVLIGSPDHAGPAAQCLRRQSGRVHVISMVMHPDRLCATPAGLADDPDGATAAEAWLDPVIETIRSGDVGHVVIAADSLVLAGILHGAAEIACLSVPLSILWSRAGLASGAGSGRAGGGWMLVAVSADPLAGWPALLKRATDVLLGSVLLAALAVPMLLIAAAIRIDSPGPVLFRQGRVGFNSRGFEMLKFRTMRQEAADYRGSLQTVRNDRRVTRIGALLRRSSLDELPQIINVLRGEMSLVGPRPHAPGTTAAGRRFEQVVAGYAARHRVPPGITGLAQVRGFRGPTQAEEQLRQRLASDLEYIDRWSVWLDLVILARTLLAVVRMENAF